MSPRRPARPRELTTQELRAELVRQAIRLIAEHGFEAMSVADVAAAASISKQALLYHFKSKELLKQAVLGHLMDLAQWRLIGFMGALERDDALRWDQALSFVQAFFDEEPFAARVLLRLILDGDDGALEAIRSGALPWFRWMVQELQRGQKDGRVRPELDPEAAAVQVGTMVLSTFALLPIDGRGWTRRSAAAWRTQRLEELIRSVRLILFVDPPTSARKRPSRSKPRAS